MGRHILKGLMLSCILMVASAGLIIPTVSYASTKDMLFTTPNGTVVNFYGNIISVPLSVQIQILKDRIASLEASSTRPTHYINTIKCHSVYRCI